MMMKMTLLVSDPTVSIQAQPLVSRFHQTPSSLAACLPLNCVNLSATACVPPPPCPPEPDHSSLTQPCPFERNCSSPTSTRPFQAQPLASHPTVSIRAQLLMSYPLPGLFGPDRPSLTQLHPFKCNRSSPASTRPFRAQPFCLPPNCVDLSAITRLPPPPCQSERNRLCSTPTVSIRA